VRLAGCSVDGLEAQQAFSDKHDLGYPLIADTDAEVAKAGQAACEEADVAGISDDLCRLLGQLTYRTSYGQNVLRHVIETAHLAGVMAGELGMDQALVVTCQRRPMKNSRGKTGNSPAIFLKLRKYMIRRFHHHLVARPRIARADRRAHRIGDVEHGDHFQTLKNRSVGFLLEPRLKPHTKSPTTATARQASFSNSRRKAV
jgi:hypothetical protein